MQTDVPASARRRAGMSVDAAWKSVMLLLERTLTSTLSGERQIPWILTAGCFCRREVVMRRAILPVKPAIATVGLDDIAKFWEEV